MNLFIQILLLIATAIAVVYAIKSFKFKKITFFKCKASTSKDFNIETIENVKLSYNNKIYNEIISEEYIIFNRGSFGIDKNEIENNNLSLISTGEDAEILDYKRLAESQEDIKPNLIRLSENQIGLTFSYLFSKASIRFKIIYGGNSPELKFNGKIKGYPPIKLDGKREIQNLQKIVTDSLEGLTSVTPEIRKVMLWLGLFFTAILLSIYLLETFLPYQKKAYIRLSKEYINQTFISNDFLFTDDSIYHNGDFELSEIETQKHHAFSLSVIKDKFDYVDSLKTEFESNGYDVVITTYDTVRYPITVDSNHFIKKLSLIEPLYKSEIIINILENKVIKRLPMKTLAMYLFFFTFLLFCMFVIVIAILAAYDVFKNYTTYYCLYPLLTEDEEDKLIKSLNNSRYQKIFEYLFKK